MSARASNHPNPAPAEVRAARLAAGLTQNEAAALLLTGLRAYQQWESGERKMHPAFWLLFRLLIGGARLPE
jgi:DNA (cytosine-5)-methyltransferase 1